MTSQPKLKITIGDSLAHLSWVGPAIRQIAKECCFGEQQASEIELCLIEAVTNCIQHAYKKKKGVVEIEMFTRGEELVFKIMDQGDILTIDQKDLSLSPVDPRRIDLVPETGRGLYIIHQLMDRVDYVHNNKKNILTLIKKHPPLPQ